MEYLVGGVIGFAVGLCMGIMLVCLCMANGKEDK